jgi:hypothetical protein
MGCCASKQQDLFIVSASANESNLLHYGCFTGSLDLNMLQDIPRTVSTTDTWALRQKSFQGGCKVRCAAAASNRFEPAPFPAKAVSHFLLWLCAAAALHGRMPSQLPLPVAHPSGVGRRPPLCSALGGPWWLAGGTPLRVKLLRAAAAVHAVKS